jgi:opacity protein-like surface antigen
MKKFGIFFVACALCMAAMVSTAKAEVVVSGDVYASMYNKYLFRGVDLSDNKWVSQFGADLSYKGLTLSYWSNLLTHDGNILGAAFESGDISETDITLNYEYSPIELLTFNVGNTFYSLENFEDTNEIYLKTSVNTLLSPTLSIFYDWDQSKETGLFYSLSVGHTFELMKGLGLNLGALVSYNQRNYSVSEAYSNWNNYELSTGLDYTINDNFSVSASYAYSNAISGQARDLGGISDESLYGIKAAFNF